MRTTTRRPRAIAVLTLPAAALIAAPLYPVASAQLPEGLSPQQVQSMLPGEISVPAGQSTTVDVGVPVTVNYSSGGWTVTSSGTAVTVSAPDQPGATAAVPASAGGYTATVNLVAVGDGTADVGPGAAPRDAGPAAPDEGSGDAHNGQAATGEPGGGAQGAGGAGSNRGTGAGAGAGTGAGAAKVSHPERSQAEPADGTEAKRLYFDGEIRDNQIVVKVPLSRVKDLLQYASFDTEGATLRYLDVNGQIIEGVERAVDKASRTLTLTYPEGETPDNPFIMELVRDGKAEFVVVITATNVPVEQAEKEGSNSEYGAYAQERQGQGVDGTSSRSNVAPLIVAGVALLAALALLIALLRRRRGRA